MSHLDDKSRPALRGATNDVLPGFMRAAASFANRKRYPPPQLPRDFRPFHKFEADSSTASDIKSDKKKLDAFSRGVALGEVPHLSMSATVTLCVFISKQPSFSVYCISKQIGRILVEFVTLYVSSISQNSCGEIFV